MNEKHQQKRIMKRKYYYQKNVELNIPLFKLQKGKEVKDVMLP